MLAMRRGAGGELRPELQSKVFSSNPAAYVLGEYAQSWNASVDSTHASWMLNHYAFASLPAMDVARPISSFIPLLTTFSLF